MTGSERVELNGADLHAEIDPLGAQLTSLRTAGGQELIWQGDPDSWPAHALILFPLIGPVTDGRIRHAGRAYPMPPHGFARLSTFAVAERTPSGCVFALSDDAETRAQYPFRFALTVAFELTEGGLLNTITVQNSGDEPMPADVGFHPGFNWPMAPGRTKDDYRLVFEKDETAPIRRGELDPVMLYPEGEPTPVDGRVLRPRDEMFATCPIVFDTLASRSLDFVDSGGAGVRVAFPDCPNLALWMIPGAAYLCIEPWQGYPAEIGFDGAFADKPGIAHLAAGETRRWRLRITPLPAA